MRIDRNGTGVRQPGARVAGWRLAAQRLARQAEARVAGWRLAAQRLAGWRLGTQRLAGWRLGTQRLARRAAPAAALAAVLLPAAACRRPDPPPEPAAEALWAPDEDTGVGAFFAAGPLELGTSRAELVAAVGEPDSVRGEALPNRHDPAVTDSLFTLYWDGLEAQVHRAGYDGKEILGQLTILHPRFMRPESPVRPGTAVADVLDALGEPDELGPDRMLYLCDDCLAGGYELARFVVARDTVRRIELRYWVD
jgi:hypothetical protein